MTNTDTAVPAVTADGGSQSTPSLVFGGDGTIIPDLAIIHDNETFAVQWSAHNQGTTDAPAFTDLLVITQIPEGCPGSDDQDHPVVFSSEKADNPADYAEGPIPSGAVGQLMQPRVGPFPAGTYRLTVTLAIGLVNLSNFNCIEIIPSN
jgi:hypothetical protein